jgi:hypothetical protein
MGMKKDVIAPNDERAVMAMDKQQKAIEKATELYGDGQPFDVERILDCMEFRSEQVGKNLNAFGRYCLWLRDAIGWGGFIKALESRHLDVRASYHAMLQVEKFGDNFATVANLGSRKARAIAYFTKEEIDQYVKGDDLRGIPHDDVARKTAKELEDEVRRLRKKEGDQKARHKQVVREMSAELEELRLRDSNRPPPTKEDIALAELEAMSEPYYRSLGQAVYFLTEAAEKAVNAQYIKNVDTMMLENWLHKWDVQLEMIDNARQRLGDIIDHIGPVDKGSYADGFEG